MRKSVKTDTTDQGCLSLKETSFQWRHRHVQSNNKQFKWFKNKDGEAFDEYVRFGM